MSYTRDNAPDGSYVYDIYDGGKSCACYHYTKQTDSLGYQPMTVVIAYHQGTFIKEIIAEDGTYPRNGIQGSYYYVRDRVVDSTPTNTAPTTPATITVSPLKVETSVTISWGQSYDVEGDAVRYYLERSVNDGSYTSVASGISGLAYTEITQTTWDRVTYRVRAFDGKVYSGYRTSSVGIVDKTPPPPPNKAPTISGTDTDLGSKNDAFNITYSVDDIDSDDKLKVVEKINGTTIKTLANAPRNELFYIDITEEMLFGYELGVTNTIEISVTDDKNNTAYRRYTFKRTNTPPVISGSDTDLGEKTEGFDVTFSATDHENDDMSARIYLNDRLLKNYEDLVSAQEYTYSIEKLDFVQLGNTAPHKIRIEVKDINGATSIRNYTFTRTVGRVMYRFKKETDVKSDEILVTPTWHVAEGAEGIIKVCNNAWDNTPTWEEYILGEKHIFTNDVKTATKWGVGVEIVINKGTATEISWSSGFGGGYR